jgi:hypothetical protein
VLKKSEEVREDINNLIRMDLSDEQRTDII